MFVSVTAEQDATLIIKQAVAAVSFYDFTLGLRFIFIQSWRPSGCVDPLGS